MMSQTKVATTQRKALVKWKDERITVTFDDIKRLICPLASNQEANVFLKICQSLNLNPFANEIYLIKYSEKDKAAIVISIDSYLKSAESNENFDGHEAGIILRDSNGKLEFREGSLLLPDEAEKLVGGWARIFRKDREKPFYMAINKAECLRYTRDGELTKFWTKEKQPSMLRKTALKRALVEAFPSLFAGTMSSAEVAEEPEVEYHEVPEGQLPTAYERNGEANWDKWWTRQKEKGLSEDDVRRFLGVASLKKDWIKLGRTLEEAEDIINDKLTQQGTKTADEVEGEGFSIDLTWLQESLKALKWTNETMKSFVVVKYKVDGKGALTEVLGRLTKEQAEDFVSEINKKLDRQTPLF